MTAAGSASAVQLFLVAERCELPGGKCSAHVALLAKPQRNREFLRLAERRMKPKAVWHGARGQIFQPILGYQPFCRKGIENLHAEGERVKLARVLICQTSRGLRLVQNGKRRVMKKTVQARAAFFLIDEKRIGFSFEAESAACRPVRRKEQGTAG